MKFPDSHDSSHKTMQVIMEEGKKKNQIIALREE